MSVDIKYRQIQHDGYYHNDVIENNVESSWFDLSHSKLLTFDLGELVPMLCMEIAPNDYIEMQSDALIRLAPLVAPLMHHLKLNTRYYFIPNRLMWNESGASWTDFITGGTNGTDATVHPYISAATYQEGTLADYLGIPIEVSVQVSPLPFRAYGLVYNEYFMNEDVQTALTVSKNSGADTTTNTTLKSVNWEDAGDYFVGASETLQRGTAVSLPLGTSARIAVDSASGEAMSIYGTASAGYYQMNQTAGHLNWESGSPSDSSHRMYADLSAATAATIADIRNASSTQLLQELLQFSGSRYRNYLQAIFGVKDYEDYRLSVPEVLGGKTTSVVVSEVLSTNGAAGGGIASMAGHGIAPHKTDVIKHRFKEFGILLGLCYIVPEAIYQEGLHKMFSRSTKLEYLNPTLALIGNQAIKNRELYAAHASPTGTFAYTRRYGEWMSIPSMVHGDFKSESDTTLEQWHLARDFSSDPSFNSTFLTCDPDKARIFASSSADCVYAQFVHYIKARRALPKEDAPYQLI